MKDRPQRMDEFVQYHINGDGECNNVVLKEWAARKKLSLQERYLLSFLFSVTYCVQSALILFEEQLLGHDLYKTQPNELKRKIVYQSDRKYMRMKDNYERCMDDFFQNHSEVNGFLGKVVEGGRLSLDKAIKYVSSWVMYGRFASFLFLETFVELTGAIIENAGIDWKHGDTATSGLLNLFGLDEQADLFDKTGELHFEKAQMDKMLSATLAQIKRSGGNDNVTEVETSLCAYRKFYKGTRYNGFYLDRMLEEIYAMQNDYPRISKELLDIRAQKFDRKYLGEYGGWTGIRKDLKKLYQRTGEIS